MKSDTKDKENDGSRAVAQATAFFQEESMFQAHRVFPGIVHITDVMGVSFTLIEGEKRAVLFDTGYGMENVNAYVKTLTEKPLLVYLSHGHHDHMLGAAWFENTRMCREDTDEFLERTAAKQREQVRKQAEEINVPVPDSFMDREIPTPEAIRFDGKTGTFDSLTEDLGGMKINIIRVPGHTPGSIVIHIPVYDLLLTGDDWNPCTWMWFPSSLGADSWRDNMLSLINALEEGQGREIRKILCSHQPAERAGNELKEFLAYMTDARIKEASGVDMGSAIDTRRVVTDKWTLIFDYSKIRI